MTMRPISIGCRSTSSSASPGPASDTEGKTDAFLVFNSSNGLHAPTANEGTSPRAWYESNNVLGIVVAPFDDLQTGLAYTIKTSPNGVSPTSHEPSVNATLEGDAGLAALGPTTSATWRLKGGGGLFTQFGIEPSIAVKAARTTPR